MILKKVPKLTSHWFDFRYRNRRGRLGSFTQSFRISIPWSVLVSHQRSSPVTSSQRLNAWCVPERARTKNWKLTENILTCRRQITSQINDGSNFLFFLFFFGLFLLSICALVPAEQNCLSTCPFACFVSALA